MKKHFVLIFLVIPLLISACSHNSITTQEPDSELLFDDKIIPTATPFQPGLSTELQTIELEEEQNPVIQDSSFNSEQATISLVFDPNFPQFMTENLIKGSNIRIVGDLENADLALVRGSDCEDPVEVVYVLVAPFPTIRDSVSLTSVEAAWAKVQSEFGSLPILMTSDTYDFFASEWGPATEGAIHQINGEGLVEMAWETGQYAIIPFHQLEGRWKVIAIDGKSALDQNLTNSNLPLSYSYCLKNLEVFEEELNNGEYTVEIRPNRDLDQLTSLTMTGVTALVRATAHKMETQGINYPGEKIRELLLEADFTHISNEVAFAESCPYPNPYQTDLRFCSSPTYIDLLQYLDIDIIELTGNHIQDWSKEDFVTTLGMYDAGNFAYFGGGRNLDEAKTPLLIEHNGNRLAFVGCNAVGPYGAFATETSSGNVPCGDYSWINQVVKDLTAEGYLVIVTLQHNEFYGLIKTGPQMRDFNPLAQAGAAVVSGSQAHYPNPFGFEGNHFIHYGLGNLFFDQMDAYVADGIQREFVDTHYFYDGRYISTVVHTLYLENFAQPRFMTPEERILFLEEAFKASGW
jgi:poly-gamma-glutamate synthesis protein (capsule biosynthesis protein)